jgi:serine/threonine protein kinase
LLFQALERLEADGDGVIDELCAGDAERAGRLRLEISKLRRMGLLEGDAAADEFPEQLGEFRLLERIGAGGMGVVYLAEQASLGRHVALKLIRPELMYFPGQRERFRREVEAVAAMQHPGIVPIHTVGEENGVLFFTMEKIEGRTLGELLAALAGSDPREVSGADLAALVGAEPEVFPHSWVETCVRITRQVAEALEHAHGRGVIHRDVKPSNIAITRGGRAMLLDFGLASRGGPEGAASGDLTRSGSQPGSLPYMSPEQVRGEKQLDARTDVYSLGASFYEMLTLTPAFTSDSATETTRRIETGRFASIGSRNPAVPWDARTVCMAAMDPDRERRYATTADFARDLGHLLSRHPIEARRTGPWLRLLRWSQRNPTTGVAALLFLVMVAAAASVVAWQRGVHAAALAVERDLQADRAREAERVSDFLVELFQSANPNVHPEEVSVLQLLDEGAASIRGELEEDPLVRARLMHVIGLAYSGLSANERARPLLEAASELRAAELGPDHPHTLLTRLALARATTEADVAAAEAIVLAVRAGLQGREDPSGELHALAVLGSLRKAQGRWDEAEQLYLDVRAGWVATRGAEDATAVEAGEDLGYLYLLRARYGDALPFFLRSLEFNNASFGADHPRTLEAHHRLGLLYSSLGRRDEAMEHLELARVGRERVLGARHTATLESRASLAEELHHLGRRAEALGAFDEVLAEFTREFGERSPRTLRVRTIRASVLTELGRHREAHDEHAEVLAAQEEVLGPDHPHAGSSRLSLATTLVLLGQYEEAIPKLEEAIERSLESLGPDHEAALSAMNSLAGALYLTQRGEEALHWTQQVVDGRMRALGPEHYLTLGARDNLARLHILNGDFERAETEMLEVRATRERALGAGHQDTMVSGSSLGHLYREWGQLDESEAWLSETREVMERELGAEHPSLHEVLHSLGSTLYEAGELERALDCLQVALEGRRGLAGAGHPDTLKSQRSVAVCLLDLGRLAEARPHLIALLEHVPPADPRHAEFRSALADVDAALASEP